MIHDSLLPIKLVTIITMIDTTIITVIATAIITAIITIIITVIITFEWEIIVRARFNFGYFHIALRVRFSKKSNRLVAWMI